MSEKVFVQFFLSNFASFHRAEWDSICPLNTLNYFNTVYKVTAGKRQMQLSSIAVAVADEDKEKVNLSTRHLKADVGVMFFILSLSLRIFRSPRFNQMKSLRQFTHTIGPLSSDTFITDELADEKFTVIDSFKSKRRRRRRMNGESLATRERADNF